MPKTTFIRDTRFYMAVCPCGWHRKCRTEKHMNMVSRLHDKQCKNGERTNKTRDESLQIAYRVCREEQNCPQTNVTRFMEDERDFEDGNIVTVNVDGLKKKTEIKAVASTFCEIKGLVSAAQKKHSGDGCRQEIKVV